MIDGKVLVKRLLGVAGDLQEHGKTLKPGLLARRRVGNAAWMDSSHNAGREIGIYVAIEIVEEMIRRARRSGSPEHDGREAGND